MALSCVMFIEMGILIIFITNKDYSKRNLKFYAINEWLLLMPFLKFRKLKSANYLH